MLQWRTTITCWVLLGVLLTTSCRLLGPATYVFDREMDLTRKERRKLGRLYRSHERRTGNEIALVTSATMDSLTGREFATNTLNRLGVGERDRNNGVLIAYSKGRRTVFVSTGFGTARVLHDSICQRIVDRNMIPYFKNGEIFQGLWEGSNEIVRFLERPGNEIK